MKQHAPGFLAIVQDAKSRIQEINIDDLKRKQAAGEHFLLIDVREDHEWKAGHIPGAVHLGKGIIERDIEVLAPDHDRPILLYCGGGFRSALAADNLQKMGYTHVLSVDGGFRGWTESGGACTMPEPTP
jgi:rhodanese-related sulfurtransferase